jgi:hypothetical protein
MEYHCGVVNSEVWHHLTDVLACRAFYADCVGFVFADPDPRLYLDTRAGRREGRVSRCGYICDVSTSALPTNSVEVARDCRKRG